MGPHRSHKARKPVRFWPPGPNLLAVSTALPYALIMKYGSKTRISSLRERDVGSLNGRTFIVSAYSPVLIKITFTDGKEQFVDTKSDPEVTYLGKKRNH